MTTTKVQAYAAQTASSALAPFGITRRGPRPLDVEIEILYCGVCHSDVHQARNEWHNTIYPCVPGHEIVGRVTRVGSRVTKFRPGDPSAVGCMVGISDGLRGRELQLKAWNYKAIGGRSRPASGSF